MTDGLWRPLELKADEERLYEALYDGVPEWMKESLWHWLELPIVVLSGNDPLQFVHRVERRLRLSIPVPPSALVVEPFIRSRITEAGLELRFTDYVLSQIASEDWTDNLDNPESLYGHLDSILRESGSKWTLGDRLGSCGLVQRVSEGVQMASDEAMKTSGHAGKRLAEAWGAAFGIHPDPTKAYGLAVKAVEDAALPKIPLRPNDHRTLGSVIRVLNSANYDAADWTLGFQREDKHYSNGQTLVAMLKTLWSGQTDRHGGDHEMASGTVITQESAEAAVMLAVPLVRWFSGDFIVASGNRTKLPPE